ncbi:adenylate/guanylate cyclase domain-containing protein [Microvirga yunnanensis]|uniref:adenylate/guanylate cyclase domain-containing protein n=1 Tax=Microvirga yunnanensis TaxID=2953740 RepID=UPI0021C75E36|nr:adenylate/guanylate cyclase domain-containing protein [Microvirga sp. HBU65207]
MVSSQRVHRRLAAILAADVVGFSALMEQDEEGTLARVKQLRRDLIEPKVQEHGGRVFKTTGDGFLAEFPSPVEAVRCATEVQETLAGEAPRESSDPLQLRIGINLGDIIVEEDGEVYGDGVNIAARLQQLADPGGIWISGPVHDHVGGRIGTTFENRGEQQVKNIARPVRVFAWSGTDAEAPPSASKRPPLSGRPTIAVLPFTNVSRDPEQEYFADGIVEEIITALSRVKWFFVIARNSSFTYKGRAVDVRQVGRDLGVLYVLEGAIRRAGTRVRITAQLVETATGHHIWAERFEGDLTDIFDLQDRITSGVVTAVEPNLLTAELDRSRSRPTDNLSAYDLYLRSLPEMFSFTKEGLQRAEKLLESTVELDQNFSDAWAALSDCIARQTTAGWIEDWDKGSELARRAAGRAIATDRENGRALSLAAFTVAMFAGDHDQAVDLASQALRLHPNSAYVQMNCAWVFIYNGEPDCALEHLAIARRMNPRDPLVARTLTAMALAHLIAGRFAEAEKWGGRAIQQRPNFPPPLRFRAAALAHLGRLEEASALIRHLLRVQPRSTIRRTAKVCFRHASHQAMLLEGLRLAGLPE